MTDKLKALIEDLRLNHTYCGKEVILQAADALEALQSEIKWLTQANIDHVAARVELRTEVERLKSQEQT